MITRVDINSSVHELVDDVRVWTVSSRGMEDRFLVEGMSRINLRSVSQKHLYNLRMTERCCIVQYDISINVLSIRVRATLQKKSYSIRFVFNGQPMKYRFTTRANIAIRQNRRLLLKQFSGLIQVTRPNKGYELL